MNENDLQRELGDQLVGEVLHGRMTRRELIVRASVLGLSATAVGSLLAACGSSTSSTTSPGASAAAAVPKAGGTMRVTMVPPAAALDPVTMYDAGSIAVIQQVCEYLIWVENDLSLRPVLAESWSPDSTGQVWTFRLRQGVSFNDGSPSVRSASLTGETSDQCLPTGHHCRRHQPRRSALSDTPGIQRVVKRCPCRQRTTALPPTP